MDTFEDKDYHTFRFSNWHIYYSKEDELNKRYKYFIKMYVRQWKLAILYRASMNLETLPFILKIKSFWRTRIMTQLGGDNKDEKNYLSDRTIKNHYIFDQKYSDELVCSYSEMLKHKNINDSNFLEIFENLVGKLPPNYYYHNKLYVNKTSKENNLCFCLKNESQFCYWDLSDLMKDEYSIGDVHELVRHYLN